MKVKDLLEFISENELTENDEILVKTDKNVYREVKPEIVSTKINIDIGYNKLKYNFISL
jgi:hypothetical protein